MVWIDPLFLSILTPPSCRQRYVRLRLIQNCWIETLGNEFDDMLRSRDWEKYSDSKNLTEPNLFSTFKSHTNSYSFDYLLNRLD